MRRLLWAGAAIVMVAGAGYLYRAGVDEAPEPPSADAERPHVLLITVDTLRADHVGSYGYEGARTFAMDSLADEGVRVERAYSAAPITLPSHTTILSGLYPPAHGVRDNADFSAPDELVTLPERLKEEGYETRAFVSAVVLSRRYNLSQGFDDYDDDLWSQDDPPLFMIRERPASATVDRVIDWLDGRAESGEMRPFFAWMHLFDPHQPYRAPIHERLITPSLYDADIAFADRHVGRLLGTLRERGLLDQTLVVLTSDHGESLGEHGEKTHAVFIYEATTRVPLFFRYPRRFPAGSVYPGAARTVDIMPTILGVLGLPLGRTQGVDLGPALAGDVSPPELSLYSESLLSQLGFGMAPLYGVRSGMDTFIRAPRPELYDRGADPAELLNLIEEGERPVSEAHRSRAEALDALLQGILDESEAFGIQSEAEEVDEETRAMLRALGYLGDDEVAAAVEGMDPKDGIQIHAMLEDARHLVRDEKMEEAAAAARALIEEVPRHTSAMNLLGMIELRLGHVEAAERSYLESLALNADQPRAYLAMAKLRAQQDDYDGALRYTERALSLSPESADVMVFVGFVHHLRGEPDEAERWYRRAVEADPNSPRAHRGYGDLLFRQGDYALALSSYRSALRSLPTYYAAMNQAGVSAKRIGDRETADGFFEGAARLRPDAWRPPYNLACTAALAGETEVALDHLRAAISRGLAPASVLVEDDDLESLRGSAVFSELLAEARATPRAAAEGEDDAP